MTEYQTKQYILEAEIDKDKWLVVTPARTRMSVAMSYTDETQLGRNILEDNMGSIFLTRLIRYSAVQFWLFKVY